MSAFARISMGLMHGVLAPRSEVIRPVMSGMRYFFTFSGAMKPRSEQLPDAPTPPRHLAIRLASPKVAASETEEYWRASWRRAYAPKTVHLAGVRLIWSRRVGM